MAHAERAFWRFVDGSSPAKGDHALIIGTAKALAEHQLAPKLLDVLARLELSSVTTLSHADASETHARDSPCWMTRVRNDGDVWMRWCCNPWHYAGYHDCSVGREHVCAEHATAAVAMLRRLVYGLVWPVYRASAERTHGIVTARASESSIVSHPAAPGVLMPLFTDRMRLAHDLHASTARARKRPAKSTNTAP